MNRKLKLALAALLGFSAACTSVKNTPREGEDKQKDAPDTTVVRGYTGGPRVVVMYGVRIPQQDSIRKERLDRLQRERPDSLPPVAEQPRGEDDSPSSKE